MMESLIRYILLYSRYGVMTSVTRIVYKQQISYFVFIYEIMNY